MEPYVGLSVDDPGHAVWRHVSATGPPCTYAKGAGEIYTAHQYPLSFHRANMNPPPVLDAPKRKRRANSKTKAKTGSKAKKRPVPPQRYACQLVVSWPTREGFFGSAEPIEFPTTNEGRVELLRTFGRTWAEPFRGMALGVKGGTEIKTLDLYDWLPPKGLRGDGRVVLMGDAMHQMTMCKFQRFVWVKFICYIPPVSPFHASFGSSSFTSGFTDASSAREST